MKGLNTGLISEETSKCRIFRCLFIAVSDFSHTLFKVCELLMGILYFLELTTSHGLNGQDSSGRPPPSQCITRQPQEVF